MYHLAVENSNDAFFHDYANPPVDSQNKIRKFEDEIRRLESKIDRINKPRREQVAKAQASANNAQIVSRISQ
ncbi:hypothetical protein ARMSODRAFT_1028413 [Armillaria solidipes]|uniref:Uncharacterized protein n=1 Tax=Armillaria solidipes TaxID=1076256 RepID=A0A2H3B0W1_9AGAR|nr:hypothetical protein ARMSODRAFT_1028413 [Armillaria solidipes]